MTINKGSGNKLQPWFRSYYNSSGKHSHIEPIYHAIQTAFSILTLKFLFVGTVQNDFTDDRQN